MTNYEPGYVMISEDLRGQILTGALAPGAKMPSYAQVSARYGVSAITARAALDVLRHEGLVQTRKGKGIFVRVPSQRITRLAPERYLRPHLRPTWEQEAGRDGRSATYTYRNTVIGAPAEIAARFAIEPGEPVTRTVYLHMIDGVPIAMSTAWENHAITGATDIAHPHQGPHAGRGIVPRFDAIGINIREVTERLTIRPAQAHELADLQLPAPATVIAIEQSFTAHEGTVATADITLHADRYQLQYTMPIPTADGAIHAPLPPTDGETDFSSGLPT